MSSEERKKILQMVQDGRISAEQAASLIAGAVVTNDDLVRPARLRQYTVPLRGQKFRAVVSTHRNRDFHRPAF